MSWLDISGLPLKVTDAGQATAEHRFERGINGQPMARSGLSGRAGWSRSLATRLLTGDEAWFWFRLFNGEGEAWDFEENDDVGSKGTKTITAITPATGNPKFGTYHATRSGSNIDIAKVPSVETFTVAYWYDDGGGYEHVLATQVPDDSADRIWVDGARNDAYSAPHTFSSTTVRLDTNGDFDDIVVLPFGIPTELAASWVQDVPFSPLPRLNVTGDGMRRRVCEVVGRPSLQAVNAGVIMQRVSVELQAYERAASPSAAVAWAPTDLPDLFAWWDPSDSATVTLDGSNIDQIDDKSGNNRHLTAVGTGGTIGAINGLDAVQYASASNYLRYNASVATVTDFVAVKSSTDSQWILSGSDLNDYFGATQDGGTGATDADAGSPSYRADGESVASSNRDDLDTAWNGDHLVHVESLTLSAWTGEMRIFSFGSATWLYSGEWGEVVLCDAALSTSDRQKLEGYLAHKWGLEGNLDAGHPYKAAAP